MEAIDLRWKCEEIINLFKIIYKYNYVKNDLYDPDYLSAIIMRGEQISLVAVDSSDHVVGHLALMYHSDRSEHVEIGQAVVSPQHQGQGILNRLIEAGILACSEITPETAMYAVSVTHHDHSQRSIAKFHFTETGILRGLVPSKLVDERQIGANLDVLIHYKAANEHGNYECYIAENYVEIAKYIFKNSGIRRKFITDTSKLKKTADSIYSLMDRKSYNSVEIYFKEICEESKYFIEMACHLACTAGRSFLYLYLPLATANTSSMIEILNGLGFFFAGILPGTKLGDTLILQKNLSGTPSHSPKIFGEAGEYINQFIERDEERTLAFSRAWTNAKQPKSPLEKAVSQKGVYEHSDHNYVAPDRNPVSARLQLASLSQSGRAGSAFAPLPVGL